MPGRGRVRFLNEFPSWRSLHFNIERLNQNTPTENLDDVVTKCSISGVKFTIVDKEYSDFKLLLESFKLSAGFFTFYYDSFYNFNSFLDSCLFLSEL